MIRAIARFSVDNPVAANLAMAALCLCGVIVYRGMPREVFPDFSMDRVEVFTVYPGAAPEDVERLVTMPLEEAIEGTDGVDEMVSASSEGVSRVLLTLDEGADVGTVIEDVRSAVTRGDVELPEEAEDPWVREVRNVFPVVAVYVYGWSSESELRLLADDHRRELEAIDGVSQVVTTGFREPRIWIEVDPAALERFELTLADVGRAVEAKARDAPLGSLATEQGDWLLRVDAELEWAEDLRELPVLSSPDGRIVRLAQVATVTDTFERVLTRARFNGRPCIHLQVNKKSQGDTIAIARDVHAYIDGAQAHMPAGTALGTNSDLSIYVRNRLQVMKESGTVGGLLVMAALLLFLNFRVAFITAIGIPVAFLGGILLTGMLDVTMNMVTMFGLIVVLGMIVDDAIVVGENAFRLHEEGLSPRDAAIEGTAQVGKPVVATILTSIAAFLPVLMLEGVTGQFMRPLPLVVTFCLVFSVIEALAIMPAHFAHWSRRRGSRPSAEPGGRRWYAPLRDLYGRGLRLCLHWRYVTVVAALVVASVVGAVGRYWIPFVYFDDFESKLFYVSLRLEPGSSLDRTEEIAIEVEREVLEMPRTEIESVNTLIGVSASDVSSYELGQNLAQVWIELREGGERSRTSAQIIEEIRERIADLPSVVESIEIDQPQSGPQGKAIEISARGPDLDRLRAISADMQARLAGYAGVRDVRDNLDEGKREVRILLDDRGRTLGLTEGAVAAELRAAFEGTTWGHVRRGKDDVELVVKLPERVRERRGELERLRVSTPSGARVPLGSVARIADDIGPSVITHDDRERSVTIAADVNKEEGNAAAIVGELAAGSSGFAAQNPGYRLAFKGDYEETAESLAGLRDAAFVSLALIYLILGTLFRSFAQPLVIMFIIPFAAVGTIIGHGLMDRPVSLMSLIGLLALAGVVVNDSLILVDFVNHRRARGDGLVDALVEAGRLRFRPILLTSLTTMLGLAPLTFFVTGQARFLQPMAISIFFGLAGATVLVLVLVPCVYAVVEDLAAWTRRPREVFRRMRRREAVHA